MAKCVKTIDELKADLEAIQENYKMVKALIEKKESEEADRKKAEEELKKAKLAEQKDERTKELKDKEEELFSLINAYIKDYGSYSTTNSYVDDGGIPYLWRMFL